MIKFHNLTYLDEKRPLALDFDQKVKVWLFSIQSKLISWLGNSTVNLVYLGSFELDEHVKIIPLSPWIHSWTQFSIGYVKSQELPFCSQNPKNDHFALLMIWSNFLRSYGPNLIKWFIWVYNVDVDKTLWGLTVNWPHLTFFPIQLICRSTVQLIGQKIDSKLETW